MNAVLEFTRALIERPSITPADAGCRKLLTTRLKRLGFAVTTLDKEDVSNFVAAIGSGTPAVAFAGHTDVVPPGDPSQWRSPPFEPTLRDGYLYGRGAADMKSSLAAMVVAAERFLVRHPEPAGSLCFLITSDEEGTAAYGTRHIVEHLRKAGRMPEFCVIGEPSSTAVLGDTVKNGRRGSLNGRLTVHGVQGHVAYPDLAVNPIHRITPFLSALFGREFDRGNAHYPPTRVQASNIAAGAGTANVIPGELTLDFNFRYSNEQTAEGLKSIVDGLLAEHGVDATLSWQLSGEPFLTPPGRLTAVVQTAIREELGVECQLSTSGGTSDGRFIAPHGCEVVELGPVNATIHKVNERVAIADLEPLAKVYERILIELLTP
ncbi:MAG: succinyl-diaminopimelate desuccinylase [Gammaproteobacteria bacterium]|nr:succinyl-diaminopimelate desuccinylase [Gammaproteobacteria bacterium]